MRQKLPHSVHTLVLQTLVTQPTSTCRPGTPRGAPRRPSGALRARCAQPLRKKKTQSKAKRQARVDGGYAPVNSAARQSTHPPFPLSHGSTNALESTHA